MKGKDGLEIVEFADRAAWERWLERNHERRDGACLKFAKKASPVQTVTHQEALDAAICFGWIDGQAARFDEHYMLIRFTPRRARSKWSQVNRERAERLIAAGEMRPAGLAQVEAAKADGRWEAAYPPQSQGTVPEDLQRALDHHPRARDFFATLTGSTRYAFLYRLHHVRDEGRRAQRIAHYIELLSEGKTLN